MIEKMVVGGVCLRNNVMLAPMAGFTDVAMRRLAAEFGAGLTVTEMVSAKGLLYNNPKTAELLQVSEAERPRCVQLFGSDADVMREVVKNHPLIAGFDIIDINMGCPVRKVTRSGEGSALLLDLKKAAAVVEACASATSRPVTVKIRMGYYAGQNVAAESARALESAGAAMITVHGRTTAQLYGGESDISAAYAAADAVSVPVVASGDIRSRDDALRVLSGGRVAGVMVGRAAIGKPQIFAEILGKEVCATKKDIILRHIDYMSEYFSDRYTVTNMRKHLALYLKGEKNTRSLRAQINSATTIPTLKSLINLTDQI